MINSIRKTAETVDGQWKKAGYAIDALPKIATEALTASGLTPCSDIQSFFDELAREPRFPTQLGLHSKFGDPPLTLYSTDRFVIDLYLWLKPSTSIHSHDFAGAFTVLHGKSLHIQYDFSDRLSYSDGIITGHLGLRSTEVLDKGAVRTISEGLEFVHQVLHLSTPTVSLVIRNTTKPEHKRPLYQLWKSGLAAKSDLYLSETGIKKRQMIRFFHRSGTPEAAFKWVDTALTQASDHEAFWYLTENYYCAKDKEAAEALFHKQAGQRPWSTRLLRALQQHHALTPPLRLDGEEPRLLLGLLQACDCQQELHHGLHQFTETCQNDAWLAPALTKLARSFEFDLNETGRLALKTFLQGGLFEEARTRICQSFPDVCPDVVSQDLTAFVNRAADIPFLSRWVGSVANLQQPNRSDHRQ